MCNKLAYCSVYPVIDTVIVKYVLFGDFKHFCQRLGRV